MIPREGKKKKSEGKKERFPTGMISERGGFLFKERGGKGNPILRKKCRLYLLGGSYLVKGENTRVGVNSGTSVGWKPKMRSERGKAEGGEPRMWWGGRLIGRNLVRKKKT